MEDEQIGKGEAPMELTAYHFAAMEKASVELAAMKIKEAAIAAAAAAHFAALRQVSNLPEPEPLLRKAVDSFFRQPGGGSSSSRVMRGVYRATPAQIIAVQKATRKFMKVDAKDVESLAKEIQKTVQGNNMPQPQDIAKVLKPFSQVTRMPLSESSRLHPKDLERWEAIKRYSESINRVAGVIGSSMAAGGLVISTLRQFDTSIPPPTLPECWFF